MSGTGEGSGHCYQMSHRRGEEIVKVSRDIFKGILLSLWLFYVPSQIFLYLLSNGGGGEGKEQNHQTPHWVGRGLKLTQMCHFLFKWLLLLQQFWIRHAFDSVLFPRQSLPPNFGDGLLHWRLLVWTPESQVVEQLDHSLQLLHIPS